MMTSTILLVMLTVFVSAFLRCMAGFGFALAAVPLLSLMMPPIEAVTLAVLMQILIGIPEVYLLHADAHRPTLLRLILGSLLGTPIGIAAIVALNPDVARVLIAVAILAGLLVLTQPKTATVHPSNGLAFIAGMASGTFSGLAAMPGPPAVTYYLSAGTTPDQTRASLLLFFLVVSLIAAPGLALSGGINQHTLLLLLLSLPALAIGAWCGTEMFKRLNNDQYRRIAISLMALSAMIAGWRGVSAFL